MCCNQDMRFMASWRNRFRTNYSRNASGDRVSCFVKVVEVKLSDEKSEVRTPYQDYSMKEGWQTSDWAPGEKYSPHTPKGFHVTTCTSLFVPQTPRPMVVTMGSRRTGIVQLPMYVTCLCDELVAASSKELVFERIFVSLVDLNRVIGSARKRLEQEWLAQLGAKVLEAVKYPEVHPDFNAAEVFLKRLIVDCELERETYR